jgi:hypothetical protein
MFGLVLHTCDSVVEVDLLYLCGDAQNSGLHNSYFSMNGPQIDTSAIFGHYLGGPS